MEEFGSQLIHQQANPPMHFLQKNQITMQKKHLAINRSRFERANHHKRILRNARNLARNIKKALNPQKQWCEEKSNALERKKEHPLIFTDTNPKDVRISFSNAASPEKSESRWMRPGEQTTQLHQTWTRFPSSSVPTGHAFSCPMVTDRKPLQIPRTAFHYWNAFGTRSPIKICTPWNVLYQQPKLLEPSGVCKSSRPWWITKRSNSTSSPQVCRAMSSI